MPNDVLMLHTAGGEALKLELQKFYQSTYDELLKVLGLQKRNTTVATTVNGTTATEVKAAKMTFTTDMAAYGYDKQTYGLYKTLDDEIIVSLNNKTEFPHRVHTILHETTHSMSVAHQRNAYWFKPLVSDVGDKTAFLKTKYRVDFDLFTEGVTDLFSNSLTYKITGQFAKPATTYTNYDVYMNKIGNAMFTVCGGDVKQVRRLVAEIANWGKDNYVFNVEKAVFINKIPDDSIFTLFYSAYLRAGGTAVEQKKFNTELLALVTQDAAYPTTAGKARRATHNLTKFWASKTGSTDYLTNWEMFQQLADTF